ncbi:MAG TPA: right-handed parallel beta-helix repeat-containing protein [Myxococcales bacterium]|nr:right-handed parallel beta-helix repeat-containing protein [Myxococcales bacterium]
MSRIVAGLVVLCGAACDKAGARGLTGRQLPAADVFVRAAGADDPVAPQLLPAPPAMVPDGSEARPFTTLAAALAAAPAGASLRIGEGVFRERLIIRRPVVLLGRGAGRTRIVQPDTGGATVQVLGTEHVELYGLSIEDGDVCLEFAGGSGHHLQNVELRGCTDAGLVARGAGIDFISGAVREVGSGRSGRGIDLDGGSLSARWLTLEAAGRRAVVLHGARGVLADLDARGSSLSAVQATDGADVEVLRGNFAGCGGPALYAGGARLRVVGARVHDDEYAVIGYRGAELTVEGGELTDYRVAGVAMVNSTGSLRGVTIARGGTESGVSITRATRGTTVLLADNRISAPGSMGVHVTESSVTLRGNSITGARVDRERDLGDGVYALDSEVVLEENVLRGNGGSGIEALRSKVRLNGNSFIENGRAGLLFLDRSWGSAIGNLFDRNVGAGVEVGEQARATLVQNRFRDNVGLDIDTGCGEGLRGSADLGAENTFQAPIRERRCLE